jgi:putative ATP-binding cassette transporter
MTIPARHAEKCGKLYDQVAQGWVAEQNCVSIFSYVAVLWGLTSFVLTLSVFGTEIAVGHYLVWIAFLYVGVSTLITHWLGHPLKGLFFAQEKREADFRYALVQLRDNASEIAQSGGEQAEQRRLQDRFSRIRSNWHDLILREAILNLFRRPYYYTAIRSALFFSLPAYFAGFVSFGGLMQLSGAFSRVTSTLSWFIFNYPSLAEIAAVAERLDELFTSANDPEPMPDAQVQISQNVSNDGGLHLSGVALSTPSGRALAPVPDTSVQPTEAVWISGPSGSGKSTLVGAIAGLWRYGQGQIQRPETGMMVLPQKPYLLPDGLAQAACYPHDPSDFDPEQITQVLIRVGLENRLPMLQVAGPQAIEGLSMGERQRLAFARVLLNRPHWVVLDEATSALDAQAEAELLALLRSELPGAAILCVSHSAPHALGAYATWQIGGITPARAVG